MSYPEDEHDLADLHYSSFREVMRRQEWEAMSYHDHYEDVAQHGNDTWCEHDLVTLMSAHRSEKQSSR